MERFVKACSTGSVSASGSFVADPFPPEKKLITKAELDKLTDDLDDRMNSLASEQCNTAVETLGTLVDELDAALDEIDRLKKQNKHNIHLADTSEERVRELQAKNESLRQELKAAHDRAFYQNSFVTAPDPKDKETIEQLKKQLKFNINLSDTRWGQIVELQAMNEELRQKVGIYSNGYSVTWSDPNDKSIIEHQRKRLATQADTIGQLMADVDRLREQNSSLTTDLDDARSQSAKAWQYYWSGDATADVAKAEINKLRECLSDCDIEHVKALDQISELRKLSDDKQASWDKCCKELTAARDKIKALEANFRETDNMMNDAAKKQHAAELKLADLKRAADYRDSVIDNISKRANEFLAKLELSVERKPILDAFEEMKKLNPWVDSRGWRMVPLDECVRIVTQAK